ncbi:MAG: DUF5667 domain-containing protein [Patescibacteria group bacterium]
MEDKALIAKLSYLKEIKPKQEWVVLTRQRLLGEKTQGVALPLQKGSFWGMVEGVGRLLAKLERPAFAIPALACLVGGAAVWQGALESLPGDTFYPLRAAVEQVPLRFSTVEERPFREFALAQRRLADLKVIAEQNRVKNLPSAIQEFEANASRISEGFLQIVENQPEKALQASRQMVHLQKEKSEVEKILGTKIGEEQEKEIENATKRLVEYELAYLETRSLTEEQKRLFETAKTTAGQEDYASALETIWKLSQNQNP